MTALDTTTPHPDECTATPERHESQQDALPWGDLKVCTEEWCPACGWHHRTVRTVPA